jgi:Lysyl oxidase
MKAPLAALLPLALAGAAAAHSPAPLPDLDQATPFGLSIVSRDGRLLLVFGSAVENAGRGPLVVEGRLAGRSMRAWQVVGTRRYALRTRLRYVHSATHRHWHLLGFERYELRRPRDGGLVARDRKTGFCLNDAYETRALNRVPVWTGECGRGRPDARSIREGISPGFGDDYVPTKEGQYVDVTRVAPGRYVLVHRSNPDRELRESSYANDAASVLIELHGRRVRVVARCPRTASCGT